MRIACYTLFDITKTGIINRAKPGDDVVNINEWYENRNTQCNFDTILQVISLRAQPEVELNPKLVKMQFTDKCLFGTAYKDNKYHNIWTFDFIVQHSSVFIDGDDELGYLYKDCENVPMIITKNVTVNTINKLECSSLKRNIYFIKY